MHKLVYVLKAASEVGKDPLVVSGSLIGFSLMNTGRYVLSQILDLVHWQTLKRCAARYGAEDRVRHFGCRQQFLCMLFAQLTWREGLRDIEACLNAKPQCLYHLGFREPVARSTLAEANENRDCVGDGSKVDFLPEQK